LHGHRSAGRRPEVVLVARFFSNTLAAGIGFAIPSNVVVDVAGQRIANGRVTSSPAPIASPTAS
jgi:S1-C subfamily serine protease